MSEGYVIGYTGRRQAIYAIGEYLDPMTLKQAKRKLKDLSMSYGRSRRAIYKLVPVHVESAVDNK